MFFSLQKGLQLCWSSGALEKHKSDGEKPDPKGFAQINITKMPGKIRGILI